MRNPTHLSSPKEPEQSVLEAWCKHLLCKREALGSNPNPIKKKKKKNTTFVFTFV
jgi:hypothetical protein